MNPNDCSLSKQDALPLITKRYTCDDWFNKNILMQWNICTNSSRTQKEYMFFTKAYPSALNSTYHSVLTVLMKNCEPLVLGPVFAIDKVPARQRKWGISNNNIRKMIHNCWKEAVFMTFQTIGNIKQHTVQLRRTLDLSLTCHRQHRVREFRQMLNYSY